MDFFKDIDDETDIDFFLNAGEKIDLNLLNNFPDYESTELTLAEDSDSGSLEAPFPSEFDLDMDSEDVHSSEVLDQIPPIKVILDKDIAPENLVINPVAITKADYRQKPSVFCCSFCGKRYIRELYYVKHISLCEDMSNTSKSEIKQSETHAVSSKQRKTKATGAIKSTDEELLEEIPKIIVSVLSDIMEDPINNLSVPGLITPGNNVAELAKKLVMYFKENRDELKKSGQGYASPLIDLFQRINWKKAEKREKFWQNVLNQCQKDHFEKEFSLPLSCINDTDEKSIHSLGFDFTMKFVKEVFYFENSRNEKHEVSVEFNLTLEEKQIMHYVAGYIVFSMLKRYNKIYEVKQSLAVKDAITFLQSFKSTSYDSLSSATNFEDYVAKWTNLVSRGGLVKVSFQFYSFISKVESIVKSTLTLSLLKSYRNEDIRDKLLQQLISNQLLCLSWQTLARYLTNDDLSNILFKQVIDKWVDIRAKAFVSTYLQIIKRKYNSKRGKSDRKMHSNIPAHRKTLS